MNCVVPGGVRTPRQMKLWHTPEEEARMLSQQCLKVRVEPHDVAAMVVFLASDDARMCTGHEYFVDAGWRYELVLRRSALAVPTQTMMTTVECVCAVGAQLGEGPVWSATRTAVWFVDIKGRRIHRYDERNARTALVERPGRHRLRRSG